MDDKSKKSMFGALLTQVQRARVKLRTDAIKDLWKRNGLSQNANGYKLAETTAMHDDGREVSEYRLYKLVDSTVTTLTADVNQKIETGVEQVWDGKKR